MDPLNPPPSTRDPSDPRTPADRFGLGVAVFGQVLLGVLILVAIAGLLADLQTQAVALGTDPRLWRLFAETTLPEHGRRILGVLAAFVATSLLWLALFGRATHRMLAFLTESRARNRAIVDNMADGAIHVDASGHLVALNRAAERIFGYDSRELRGQPLALLFHEPFRGELAARAADPMPSAAPDATAEIREVMGRRRDGEAFPLYLAMSRVDIGRTRVCTAIVRDLTETRRRMDELARARDEALTADRAKSEFLAVMSHEIRTPMNGVLGMLELLRDSQLTKQQEELIATAEKSGSILLTVINDILDYSKIEAGKLDLQDIEVDLRTTVEEITGLVASVARQKPIEIASYVHPDIPRRLRGDPYRLRQILMNLMGNAVKFTERGEVIVRVEPKERLDGGWLIEFKVTDTGIGIDAATLATLFRPFKQADASTTRRFGGTGLGLVISKRLVELMGGEIQVDSRPAKGSTFSFRLPMQAAAVAEATDDADLSGVRVLVVDDNATNRLILESQLQRWGALTTSVEDGEQALLALHRALAHDRGFDLAILDMQMPGMDGIELAQRIKGDAAYASMRLLMLSSLGYPGPEARRAGIEVTLLKPVREVLLHDAAAKILGMGREGAGILPATAKAEPCRFDARILVAEDNAVNQKVITMMLRRFGMTPTVAPDGQAALEAFESQEYDLILMDVQMPRLGGRDATRRIRALEQTRDVVARIPIVAMTAGVSEQDRADCTAAGMDDFISKPAQIADLERLLLRWLPGHLVGPIDPARFLAGRTTGPRGPGQDTAGSGGDARFEPRIAGSDQSGGA